MRRRVVTFQIEEVRYRAIVTLKTPPGGLPPVFAYSTVTDFARLRGLSTSVPRQMAAW